jgi:hypothetical protein
LNIVLKFRDDKGKGNRIIMILGLVTASIATVGVLFKLMHWPAANLIILSCLLVFILVFIPIYFVINYRNPESRFNAIINATFMLGAAGMLFALLNLGYSEKQLKTQDQHQLEQVRVDDQE